MEEAPLFEDIAQGPKGGRAFWLTGPGGVRIRMGHWSKAGGNTSKSTTSKGTVLLFPGRTEYVEKYGPAAAAFAAQGYDMIAVDWRGQGIADRAAAERLLGHIESYEDYQTDVDVVMAAVEKLDLPKPYYLVGHSMGGCIALRSLHRNLPVNAAVFSAPMWGINLAKAVRPLAWSMSWAASTLGRGLAQAPGTSRESYVQVAPFEDNQLTRDRGMWDFMVGQLAAYPDLALGGPSVKWLYTSLAECGALQRMAAPRTPTLTFLGSNERIVDTGPVHDIMGRWQNGQLFMVADAEHEIMMEVPATRDDFYEKAVAHFAAHA